MAKCGLCGEPMPAGEEMFNYHGYSGGCPVPPLAQEIPSLVEIAYGLLWMAMTDDKRIHEARRLLLESLDKSSQVRGIDAAKKYNNLFVGK